MKVSLSWLKAYVPVEMDPSPLADALTMIGLEVEAVSDRYAYLETVRVGRIVDITSHPNADRLSCCRVNIGDREISVVCGAPNIEVDMQVPAALPGTRLPSGLLLEKSVVRGIESQGMLCSEAELGLGPDAGGIMTIAPACPPGTPLTTALDLSDTVFEIGLTPNRPDCLSITGIAREVAAIQKKKIHLPEIRRPEARKHISEMTTVSIEAPELCPRYAAGLLEDITVGPSPFWLQDRLLSIGLRPINNIVDVTNFVMMELGQPLHAFDFDHLAEHRIVVRNAAEGERFTTLDQKERRMSANMLMICDGKKPVAIGGVMGGLNSEIESGTRRVLIESACFNPASIRQTARTLGLATDASHRFERGVDPAGTVTALNRALQLMAEISGGKTVAGIIDEHPRPSSPPRLSLSVDDTNRYLGTRLNQDEIKGLLESIEFMVETKNEETLAVTPPSFRVDVERPVDLVEEVARLSGYQNIPVSFPRVSTEAKAPSPLLALRNRIRQIMVGFGFMETINYSFIGRDACDRLDLPPADPRRAMLDVLNPLTEDQAVMRTSLLPGLLGTMNRNIARQTRSMRLFEVGKIFLSRGQENLPEELDMLAGLWTGDRLNASWLAGETPCDFYDIKGVVEGLLNTLAIEKISFSNPPEETWNYTRPGASARIFAGRRPIGLAGELAPAVGDRFDLKQTAFIFELRLNDLLACLPAAKKFQSPPRFPAISRDLTVIIDKQIEAGRLISTILEDPEPLLEDIHLFAVYDREPIPAGKKSVSIRIVYRSTRETLEDDAINKVHQSLTGRILKTFDATLPA